MIAHLRRPLLSAFGLTAAFVCQGGASPAEPNQGLTAVPGIKVGHHTLTGRPTGCTVILTEAGAVAGVDVRGASPGTRETDLLDPVNLVDKVHAIALSGGSAYGLDAAQGVVRYLEERSIGYDAGSAKVPIVPAAVLIDLQVGGKPKIRPDAACGYAAAKAATSGPVAEGTVGAGAGATVGKMTGFGRAMKGGLGTAAVTLPSGLIVAALVAVNAQGDVIDPKTGTVIAGVRTEDGRALADVRTLLRSGLASRVRPGDNTTLGIVATNAALTKAQATRIALMAHDGFARAIYPAHAIADGDTIFAVATGVWHGDADPPSLFELRRGRAGAVRGGGPPSQHWLVGSQSDPTLAEADVSLIGALGAEVMADAIVRAITQATGVPDYPAARDVGRK